MTQKQRFRDGTWADGCFPVCCLDSTLFTYIQSFKFFGKLVAIARLLGIEVLFVPMLPLVVCLRLTHPKMRLIHDTCLMHARVEACFISDVR